jgi:hypothetical protein
VDTSGGIWFREKGFTDNGGARTWSIKTSDFDPGDGGNGFSINGLRPDAEDLQGGYFVTITAKWRDGTEKLEETFGPYSITDAVGQVDLRISGDRMNITWSGNDSPSFWRGGADEWEVRAQGRKR